MLRHKWIAAAVNVAVAVAPGSSVAQELTIFWAEWDPANYLQELVNEYPDAQITVETAPWPDFQTKAFLEFNTQGDSYDMVVGDSQWLGAGSTGGHYVELTDLVKEHRADADLRRGSSARRDQPLHGEKQLSATRVGAVSAANSAPRNLAGSLAAVSSDIASDPVPEGKGHPDWLRLS